MKITSYLNTTEKDVSEKKFNVCLGLSLGNKYFTPEHIESYLIWAIENTKDKVLVLIPDEIQAINYEVKNQYTPKRAYDVAMRKGKELEELLRKIITNSNLPTSKITILHWTDLKSSHYLDTLRIIKNFFEENVEFRNAIVQMVKETPHIESLNLSEEDHAKLAQYIINELPVLINGADFQTTWYTLFPYPGFANLDYLAIDLQEGKSFPELTKKLDIRNTMHFIEVYAD